MTASALLLALLAASAGAAPEGMALVPAGWFELGAADRKWRDAAPVRRVWLDAFAIDLAEVTVADYAAYAEAAGSELPAQLTAFQDRPVCRVTWKEALDYCRSLGKRLPSEAEWEKAARAGAPGPWPPGGEKGLADFAWYEKNWKGFYSGAKSLRQVMTRKPNALGLYDMNGNASEWVLDWYDADFYRRATERNPVNGAESAERVVRGGTFNLPAHLVRSDARGHEDPESRLGNVGFRCAVEAR